ncbi:unnamed protein product [Sphagnum troendelagicum]|uniref:Uncharacterized protein n=1 Tax=Sphagnum troendelagicum TaxID=128251 RepID=A0ABP0UZD2_9BRYO
MMALVVEEGVENAVDCAATQHTDGSSAGPQLEIMGRELKCAICLSLFRQAAALSCNHTFCNVCILQSLKRSSCCPICKLPTTRREVRAAPHMDNLVSAYRHMESVLGMNFFASQPTLSEPAQDGASPSTFTNKSGYKIMFGASKSPKLAKPTVYHGDKIQSKNMTTMTRRKLQHQKELNGEDQDIQKLFEATPVVHIPLAEQAQRVLSQPGEDLEDVCGLDAAINEEAPSVEVGDVRSIHQHVEKVFSPNLSPFFWLKDGGNEELEVTQAGASVPFVSQSKFNALQPAFSDLKDADDGTFQDEVAKEGDSCDSDIFDWTQRPCSPELNCSPCRDQSLDAIEQVCCAPDTNHSPGVAKTTSATYKRRTGKKGRANRTSNAATGALGTPRTEILLETVLLPQKQKVGPLLKTPPRTETTEILLKQHPEKSQDLVSESLLHRNTSRTRYQKLSEKALWPEAESNKTCGSTDDPLTQITKSMPLGQKPMEKQRRKRRKTSVLDRISDPAVPAENHTASVVQSLIGKKDSQMDALAATAMVVASEHACGNAGSMYDGEKELQQTNKVGRKGAGLQTASLCAFCKLPGDSKEAGPMIMYQDGQRQVYVHKLCAEWAPEVYFEGDKICNLSSEVTRGQKIKCSSCGKKGAALGCCIARCHKSFHYSCARALPCRWQLKNFVMLCPDHVESKFPGVNKKKNGSLTAVQLPAKGLRPLVESGVKASQSLMGSHAGGLSPSHPSHMQKWPPGPACKWVLCGSALDSREKERLAEFSVLTGASLVKVWSSNVTHVIAGTDEQGAARRTLKYLMAILEGKWIVQADWMLACMAAGHGIKEDAFEVKSDIHGTIHGPKRGRALAAAKAPKLFTGFNFYFCGDFVASSYKADLQALAILGGGTVLHRKPLPTLQSPQEKKQQPSLQKRTIVIYNAEVPAGRAIEDSERSLLLRMHEADAIAAAAGAVASAHTWLLDSAAACKLQPLKKL